MREDHEENPSLLVPEIDAERLLSIVNAHDMARRFGRLGIERMHADIDESFAPARPQTSSGPDVAMVVRGVFEPFFARRPGSGGGLGFGSCREAGVGTTSTLAGRALLW